RAARESPWPREYATTAQPPRQCRPPPPPWRPAPGGARRGGGLEVDCRAGGRARPESRWTRSTPLARAVARPPAQAVLSASAPASVAGARIPLSALAASQSAATSPRRPGGRTRRGGAAGVLLAPRGRGAGRGEPRRRARA